MSANAQWLLSSTPHICFAACQVGSVLHLTQVTPSPSLMPISMEVVEFLDEVTGYTLYSLFNVLFLLLLIPF